jgi:hypothetical protein
MPTENTTFPDKIRIETVNKLVVRAVVMSSDAENGLSAIDFALEEETSYRLTLIQNPLIDYGHAMAMYSKLQKQRAGYFARFQTDVEPPDCSYRHLLSIWGSAHWYKVDDIDFTTVGMSATAWIGLIKQKCIHTNNKSLIS